jgi:hypothetical protein
MPGMGEDMDGAIQQAPHPTLHFIVIPILDSPFPILFGAWYTYYTLSYQFMET